ncbi:MAG: AgmX/PglI C-terminal domain-containing protein, partial [Polyangiaceae bacterium]|nr:AgmX/PglI C-terminal domain-containing protein [Polyangiaceae bacterium]
SVGEAPPPDVEVKNIGMHIGGGPNDAVTKGPIKRSVDPHMTELGACFAKAEDQEKGGDVSVDLRIEAAGGKAELKKYKSAIAGAAFRGCVETVFRTIEFEKPKTGATVVSYSLRFTPKKK